MTAQTCIPGIEPTEWGGELDFYETPLGALDAVLPFLPARFRGDAAFAMIEPCAGRGAIVRWAAEMLPPACIFAIEIHGGRFGELMQNVRGLPPYRVPNGGRRDDFLSLPVEFFSAFRSERLILSNPPFSEPRDTIAREIVEHAIEIAKPAGCVAMLLPLGFAEGVDRAERIHDRYPSSVYVFRRRPRFGGDSSGSRPFAWFVFDLLEPKREWRSI